MVRVVAMMSDYFPDGLICCTQYNTTRTMSRCVRCNKPQACPCVAYCQIHKAVLCSKPCVCDEKRVAEEKKRLEEKELKDRIAKQSQQMVEQNLNHKNDEFMMDPTEVKEHVGAVINKMSKLHSKVVDELDSLHKETVSSNIDLQRRNTLKDVEIKQLQEELAKMKKLMEQGDREIHARLDNLQVENDEDQLAVKNTLKNGLRNSRKAATVAIQSSPRKHRRGKLINHPMPDYSKVKSKVRSSKN